MSWFSDESIDEQKVEVDGESLPVAEAIRRLKNIKPGLLQLKAAAKLYWTASPAMVEGCAQWLAVDTALEDQGFDDRQRAMIYARAAAGAYKQHKVHAPGTPFFLRALEQVEPEDLQSLADGVREMKRMERAAAEIAVAMARRGLEIPEHLDASIALKVAPEYTADAVAAMSEERRGKVFDVLLSTPTNRRNALWRGERAVAFLDLMNEAQTKTLRKFIERIDEVEENENWPVATDERAMDRLAKVKALEPQRHPRGEDGLTDDVRNALGYWMEKLGQQQLEAQLGPLAESRLGEQIAVNAPELTTLETWAAATEERQNEIAKAVEEAARDFHLTFLGLETYDDVYDEADLSEPKPFAVAVFEHRDTGMKLSLVPGGTYRRGFSQREEDIVRKAGKENEGIGNWYEEYEYLFEQAPAMRPVQDVTVGPFLLFQQPADPREPAAVTVMLEDMPFRLLTEAEFEWAMRGGMPSRLTWRGDEVPDEGWMEEVMDLGPELQNPFGLSFLGLNPEVMADVWHAGYEGAPTDGSARTGDGPRVVRGGAAMLYPWQACGEWHLLTNAVRTPAESWEFFHSIRPALGVSPTN